MSERVFSLSQYPEIALIFWDYKIDTIEERELFNYIRIRTKYLYQDLLSDEEVNLINELCDEYNGVISLLKPR